MNFTDNCMFRTFILFLKMILNESLTAKRILYRFGFIHNFTAVSDFGPRTKFVIHDMLHSWA